jgi:hypothetical protein
MKLPRSDTPSRRGSLLDQIIALGGDTVADSVEKSVPVDEEKLVVPCEVYSRIVGYLRPVQAWNDGKQQEFKERQTFTVTPRRDEGMG